MKIKYYRKFINWYLKTEYLPSDKTERNKTLKSKLTLVLLFVIAFIIIGFINGYNNRVKDQLNDPYINSIPLNLMYVNFNENNFDTAFIKKSFPNVKFDYCDYVNKTILRRSTDGNKIELFGISISETHPYSLVSSNTDYIEWKNDSVNSDYSGIYLSKNGLKKLSTTLKEFKADQFFEYFNGIQIKKELPIKAICKNLPYNMDFLVYDNFTKENSNILIKKDENKSAKWNLKVFNNNQDFDKLWNCLESVEKYILNEGFKRILIDIESDENKYDILKLNFDKVKLSYEEVKSLFNNKENLKSFGFIGEETEILKKKPQKIVTFNSEIDEIKKFCTATYDSENKDQVYSLKDTLEAYYPSILIEMQAIDTVFLMSSISKTVKWLLYFMIFSLIFSYIIINWKILKLNILRKKNHMGYLKTIGVPIKAFKVIYIKQVIYETIIASSIGVIVSYFLNVFADDKSYYFTLNLWIISFVFLIILILIIIYINTITKNLKLTFRQIINSN